MKLGGALKYSIHIITNSVNSNVPLFPLDLSYFTQKDMYNTLITEKTAFQTAYIMCNHVAFFKVCVCVHVCVRLRVCVCACIKQDLEGQISRC